MNKKSAGFTLIELVIVIVILGILAATALPRFINVNEQAHTAAVDGARGGLASGVALARALWMAGGGSGTTVTMDGGAALGVTTAGWPSGQAGANPATATDCVTIWDNVLQNGPSVATAAGSDYQATLAGTTCTYTYQADSTPARTITYDASSGVVQ